MERGIRNFGLAFLVTGSLLSCSDSATTTSVNKDSLMQDSMKKATDQMATNTEAQSDDAKLVSELVESMYGGIALMKQAQTKATAQPVKDLAKKLETEHTSLTNDLKALAAKKGWSIPAGEAIDDSTKRQAMAGEEVADYQKDWLNRLQERHETNIKKLEDHKTTDPDLQAAAAKGLPKLRGLLLDIENVQKGMK